MAIKPTQKYTIDEMGYIMVGWMFFYLSASIKQRIEINFGKGGEINRPKKALSQ